MGETQAEYDEAKWAHDEQKAMSEESALQDAIDGLPARERPQAVAELTALRAEEAVLRGALRAMTTSYLNSQAAILSARAELAALRARCERMQPIVDAALACVGISDEGEVFIDMLVSHKLPEAVMRYRNLAAIDAALAPRKEGTT